MEWLLLGHGHKMIYVVSEIGAFFTIRIQKVILTCQTLCYCQLARTIIYKTLPSAVLQGDLFHAVNAICRTTLLISVILKVSDNSMVINKYEISSNINLGKANIYSFT